MSVGSIYILLGVLKCWVYQSVGCLEVLCPEVKYSEKCTEVLGVLLQVLNHLQPKRPECCVYSKCCGY